IRQPCGRIADADDLPQIVDAAGGAESPTQRPEVRHRAVLPEKAVADPRKECKAVASDDLPQIVNAQGFTLCLARESSEVRHRAVLPEEGVEGARGREADADDLPQVVDAVGVASSATERPEVGHYAVLADEGVGGLRGGGA